MKILLIHLSDMHFLGTERLSADPARVADACAGYAPSASKDRCFAVVSGDVAYSGRAVEYQAAIQFLQTLKSRLCADHRFQEVTFVIVPGNHDCDFSSEQSVRDLLISQVDQNGSVPTTENFFTQLLLPQEEFFRFHFDLVQRRLISASEKILHTESYQLPKTSVHFHCINTAWISRLKERQGTLYFPVELLSNNVERDGINIAIFHHPYNWLPADNARQFRTRVEAFSDIILTGHEHVASQFARIDSVDNTANEYFEGGALHDPGSAEKSSFNVFVVDVDGLTFEHATFQEAGGIYQCTTTAPSPRRFGLTKRRAMSACEIRTSFRKFLEDPGATFSHPNVDRLTLDNIFTPPDLQEIKISSNGSRYTESIVSGASFAPYVH